MIIFLTKYSSRIDNVKAVDWFLLIKMVLINMLEEKINIIIVVVLLKLPKRRKLLLNICLGNKLFRH